MSRTKVTWRARIVPRNPAIPPNRTPANRFLLEATQAMKPYVFKMAASLLVSLALFLFFSLGSAVSQQPVASFFYDERGNVVRQERDTNGDGKMDRWTYYDRQGQIEKVEQDINFDGKPDIFV